MRRTLALILACLLVSGLVPAFAGKTRNVVIITTDGLRWREVFAGADPTLMNEKDGGIWVPAAELEARYGGTDPATRRRKLFPFLWGELAKHGQLFGNQTLGSHARTTNTVEVSYPGYSEMLSGRADPRITGNDYGANPNITVLEWLNADPQFHGRVEVFAAWSKFHDILAEKRSGLPIRAGASLLDPADKTPQGLLLAELYRTTARIYGDDPYDSFVHVTVREHLKKARPRVLLVAFGDTDLWQHMGRYDAFLESAHAFDEFVASLWHQLQAIPDYRDSTTLIVSTDHGRGSGPAGWKDHDAAHPGSGDVWIGVLGPDTQPLGERRNTPEVTQAQIASTVAALLGEDFRAFRPEAAGPLGDVLEPAARH